MKIGVSSYSFSSYIKRTKCDYFHICDKAKALGFDGIEFVNLDFPGWNITDNPIKTAVQIKAYCDKIGLEIFAYTVSANFFDSAPEAEAKRICECLDVAKALGAPILRHDICWSLPKEHPYSYRDAIKLFAPHIRTVTEYAESLGIKTCTENHGFIFQSPERIEELILAVNHKNFGWLCDMGNFLCADVNPSDAIKIAAPYTFHVHAKDFLYKSGESIRPEGFFETSGGNYLRGTVAGHGIVPIASCINALKKAGYDGVLSLEFEGPEDTDFALINGLAYLRKLV